MNVPLFVVAATLAWMLAGVALASALGPRLRRCGEAAGGAEDRLTSQPGGALGAAGGRRDLARWTLPGSVAAFAFASSTGLAAAGVLPHPAQGVARSVLSSVRLEVPAAPDDRGEREVVVPESDERPSSEASGSGSSHPGEAREPEVLPADPGASIWTGVEPGGVVGPLEDDAPRGSVRDGDDATGADEAAGSVEPQDPALQGGESVVPPRGRPGTVPVPGERPAAGPVPAVDAHPEGRDDRGHPGAPAGGPDVADKGRGPADPPAAPNAEGPPGLAPGGPDTPARHEPPPGARPDRPAPPAAEPEAPATPGPPVATPGAPAGTPGNSGTPGPPPGTPAGAAEPGARGKPAHAGPGAPERPAHQEHPLGADRSHPGRGRGLSELPAPGAADAPTTSLPASTSTITAQLEG